MNNVIRKSFSKTYLKQNLKLLLKNPQYFRSYLNVFATKRNNVQCEKVSKLILAIIWLSYIFNQLCAIEYVCLRYKSVLNHWRFINIF